MRSTELRKIFEPAYRPCVHLSGICRDTCIWWPERGLVPRGFGGATATPDAVRLVLVTSEPGDPGDDEQYKGSASEMLSTVLENRRKYLVEGVLRRNGQPEPYNRNLRKILDLCWPNSSIEKQLEQTWITNSVKCSAPKSSDEIPPTIEQVCVEMYLRKELSLFADAFVLALGYKAETRLKNCGIRVDAAAKHPSARRKDNPEATWRSASRKFRNWLKDRGTT